MGTFVFQCIKTNRNRFGFGYAHKKGHYVAFSGRGTLNLQNAHIYDNFTKSDWGMLINNHPFAEGREGNKWKSYYKCVPVSVKISLRKA